MILESKRNALPDAADTDGEGGVPVLESKNWEKRLQDAREQRTKIRAARELEDAWERKLNASNPIVRKYWALRRRSSQQTKRGTSGLAAQFFVQASMVFVAALGIGAGGVLALSWLDVAPRVALVPKVEATTPDPTPPAVEQAVMVVSDEKLARVVAPVDILEQQSTPDFGVPDISMTAPKLSPGSLPRVPVIEPIVSRKKRSDALPILAPADVVSLPVMEVPTKTVTVYLHAPSGIPRQTIEAYVSDLDKIGVGVARIGREAFSVSNTHVRFYSADVESSALALADTLQIEARDFSQRAYAPDRIEIWVAGRPQRSKVVKEEPKGFFARLIDQL